VALACSHGELIDPTAEPAILNFCADFKPHTIAHLGDWCDTQAWRQGAKGTKDETHSIADDINAGLIFLSKLRPTIVFNGNHEHRIWRALTSPNAIIAHAACVTIHRIREFMEDQHAKFIEGYDWSTSWAWLGDRLIGHGISFSQNALRDHAQKVGNCFIGHLHIQESACALARGGPNCACVGYLGQEDKFTYADGWASRMRWQTGWIFGEYTDNQTVWQHHKHHAPKLADKELIRL
jgi:hypothetical protein